MNNKNIMIIAHRGASAKAPENTLASVSLAWETGVDAVEIDIHLSHDSIPMVIHDPNTKRTTGVDLTVAQTISLELRMLDAGSWKSTSFSGLKIPFLNEVLETVPLDKKLFIEIKSGPETVYAISDLISPPSAMKQIVIQSFDIDTIIKLKEILPSIPTLLLLETLPINQDIITLVQKNGFDGLSVKHTLLSGEFAGRCKNTGLKLFVWTVDSQAEAKRVALLGVDGIITNKPDEIMCIFRETGNI